MQDNIKNNNISDNNINLINKAVWINDNGINFYSDKADGGSVYDDNSGEKIFINTVRLKEEIEKEIEIDFLKLDVEGAEVEIIKDCENILYKVNRIFIEYHSFIKKAQELDVILSILKNNNFRYYLSTINSRKNPFINNKKSQNNMDYQTNIFAYRLNY